ncbi:uncharacterized protein [Anabrus simplex]|uniref:uncharacterized protein n=1 Tax=Anabrus simplex TaxID=316456 RepID=UPI0035A2CCBE
MTEPPQNGEVSEMLQGEYRSLRLLHNLSLPSGDRSKNRDSSVNKLNLALEQAALISSMLWNYRAALAVDGNPETCSYTPRTSEQRWWQVDLGTDHHVGSVALVINKDIYQEFTIFVIQLLSKSEALYKPCATFKGRFQTPRVLFTCNDGDGHQGRYIYIRDDRRDQDYFALCEVEVFSHRDETMCGDPEEPVAGQVMITSDSTAIYSCITGYRLLAEPNRTCERDGHWTGHAPQCEEIPCNIPPPVPFGYPNMSIVQVKFSYGSQVKYRCLQGYVVLGNASRVCTKNGVWSANIPNCIPITCGYPKTFPNADIELLNHSTLWNTVAIYSCKAGYSLSSGVIQVSTTCQSSGSWEKVNITCILDGDRNLPVKLTGKEWSQETSNDEENQEKGVGTPGLISIGIVCSLLVIVLAVLAIVLARRFRSKKAAQATQQSSTNDLINGSNKEGSGDTPATSSSAPAVSAVTITPAPPQVLGANEEKIEASNMLPLFSRNQENLRYDTLQSFPSASSYNSTVVTDVEDHNFSRMKSQEKLRRPPNSVYECMKLRPTCSHDPADPSRSLQQLAAESSYEMFQSKEMPGNTVKAKGKTTRSFPAALKLFLQPSSKAAESELNEGPAPTEVLALYAQVDKSKKRKYRPDMAIRGESEMAASHSSCPRDEDCECTKYPISDIARISQETCNPVVWNGNSKDCGDIYRECALSNGRPLPPVPSIRFIQNSKLNSEIKAQTIECDQL